jgi:hypothetical protein
MKTKMKTDRILIPILLLFVLLSAASPVLATNKQTFQYAAIGHIDNMDKGVGASMSLTLKGTLTLGTPNYDSGWSDWRIEDRGWYNYNGWYDLSFPWTDPPQWLQQHGFTPDSDRQYRAHVEWDSHEHWKDHLQSWDYRWYTPKGSWSGQLVAMWNGGTSPETFSVSLSPWKVEKGLRQGNMYMDGDSWRHEKWDVYWVNTGGPEQHVGTYEDKWQIGGGFNYYAESLQINFDGKFTTKNKRLSGDLYVQDSRFWMGTLPPSLPSGIGISGNGEFGPYSFNFPS